MGNYWSQQKTDEVEIQLKLHKECKDNICKLDDSMVKLLTSLDAMYATAEMLYEYLDISHGDTGAKADMAKQDNIWERKAVAARLLNKMEKIVCTEKQNVVNSLTTFLHFVILNTDKIFKTDSEGFNALKLDEYRRDPNEWDCTEDNVLQTIQNENKTLKEENTTLEDNIVDLNARLKEEENNTKKRIEHIQNELTNLKAKKTVSQKLNHELQELKNKTASQNKELAKQEMIIKGLEKNRKCLEVDVSALRSKYTNMEKQNDDLILKLNEVRQEKEELDSLTKEKISLNDQMITEINAEKSSLNAALKQKEESIAEFNKKIEKAAELTEKETELHHKTYVSKLNEKDEAIAELRADLLNFEQQIRNNETMITNYESEKKTITEENINLRRKETELLACLNNKEKDVENLRHKINVQFVEMQRVRKEMQDTTSELLLLKEQISKLQMKETELSACLKNKEKDEENLRNEIDVQFVEIQRLGKEMKDTASQLLLLKDEINEKEKNMQIIRKECDEKKSEIITLTSQYEEKLIRIMSRKQVQVQLYGQQSFGWTSETENELMNLLKTEMKSVDDKLELSFFKVKRPSDILPNIPLLMVCVTISRLGTDVINATQGLALAPNMALTIFHHKDEHALPNQASERVLMSKELRCAGGIFDMAFKSDKGIYSCDMNDNTISSLVTFIRRSSIICDN